MRDILFRGKRLDNGEWVYGFYCHVPRGRLDRDEHLIQTVMKSGKMGMLHCVDPSTVGQYAGIRDKNGERIFEGDIVKGRYSGKVAAVQAEVWNCGCCHGVLGFSTETCDPDLGDTLVVIGNIHDNTELLEGGEEE